MAVRFGNKSEKIIHPAEILEVDDLDQQLAEALAAKIKAETLNEEPKMKTETTNSTAFNMSNILKLLGCKEKVESHTNAVTEQKAATFNIFIKGPMTLDPKLVDTKEQSKLKIKTAIMSVLSDIVDCQLNSIDSDKFDNLSESDINAMSDLIKDSVLGDMAETQAA